MPFLPRVQFHVPYHLKGHLQEIINLIKLVFPIFAKEFHLKSEQIQEDNIKDAIEVLENMSILRCDEKGNIFTPIEKTHNFNDYIALTNLCELTLKRFYIVMSVMWKREKISESSFIFFSTIKEAKSCEINRQFFFWLFVYL